MAGTYQPLQPNQIKDMAEIFQKIKQENTAKIFHENYIVKHNPMFGLLTLIHNTGKSNILPTNTQDTAL